jgi:penicillin-binding protein 1A
MVVEFGRVTRIRLPPDYAERLMRTASRKLVAALAALGLLGTSCGELVDDLPELTKADLRFRPPQSSKVYAQDGTLITTFYGEQDRTVIPLKRVPRHVRRAVVAIEDERFYKHGGVDLKAIVRAALTNASSGRIQEGGSTITQQYVKNVIISPGKTAEKTLDRKIHEAALARQIETKLSKKEILERYLNTIYFGQRAYGIQAASKTYFGKPAGDLTLHEGALLAGVIRAPGDFDPVKHPKAAKKRRNVVLDKMADLGHVRPRRAARAKAKPLRLRSRDDRGRYPAPYFVDYVQKLITYDPRFEALGDTPSQRSRKLFQGGLRIYTTVDLDMQRAAEQAVTDVLPYESDPHGSLVAVDPATGHVKAMVGGRDYFAKGKGNFAKLNLAILAEPDLGPMKKKVAGAAAGTGRQGGSAFKPFALAAAVEQGIPLSKQYEAGSQMTFPTANNGGPWVVHNYEGGDFGSKLSLLEATVNSVNVVYAQLILEIGPESVVETARKMGIRTELAAVNAAVLGANSVNPLGMASAYGAFATNGMSHPPVAVTRITDPTRNKVIYEDDTEPARALGPGAAYIVTTALQQAVQRGTGYAANIGRPVAGKTGTAQEYRDAWFAGYTPDLAAAVWVGYPEGEIEMKPSCVGATAPCRPTRIDQTGVTGGSYPADIWHDFMLEAVAGTPITDFEAPVGLVTVTIDTRTGCLADDRTPDEYRNTATFVPGTEPTTSSGAECKPPEEDVAVPDVFTFPVAQAVQTLEGEGFEVVQTEAPSSTYPPGRVIDQSPPAGEEVPEGSTVTITISD